MADISKTEKVQLHTPDLEELRGVLQTGLETNFAEVQVCVVECPDLTKEPFQFPVKGLCGNPRITDVGGVPYLIPLVQKHKEYNMNTVSKELELPGAFILGAAAAPSRITGMNAELMPLVLTEAEGRPAVNSSYFSSINPADGQCLQEKYSDRFSGCNFALLGNLYACEGRSGKVIEVRAKKRTGGHSLVTALRKTLEDRYPDKSLALGGTFIIQKGKAKIHIMPREFSACPLNTNDEVNNWLKHFEVSAPLICQSVLVSRDPGLDLRVEHTHCFSHHGEGGHYYIDTTPDSVEYLGYFMPAEFVYRIDRPRETHTVGRD
ncbi:ester hydrolase C11orf54 homolog [Thunnus maccoyii]|uniref:ester hydrolase C11orf54 homolog n=1 Tax=Thunnus maccoyii TaxID=8240 RepID=UPI001C4D7897|nr:ester hydrolase C11orf54 homolog [Thunnus maccoyii]XP_042286932.1 ester hydrolase C11orf54 homolog [Thunnus maccoyii]XP_042286933.1 ester hydrolase C11orf54 homolog [Thunnus maccoyii]